MSVSPFSPNFQASSYDLDVKVERVVAGKYPELGIKALNLRYHLTRMLVKWPCATKRSDNHPSTFYGSGT